MARFGGLFGSAQRRERVEPRLSADAFGGSPAGMLNNPSVDIIEWSQGGGGGSFGPPINEQNAMRVSAVFRCVSLLSGLIASLPLGVYIDTPGKGRRPAPDHKLDRLLGRVPYPGRAMSSFVWRELWAVNLLLWGNHYSRIRYDNSGRIVGFEPLNPWDVEVYRTVAGRNAYRLALPNGGFEVIDQEDILHFVGLGFDGLKGASVIKVFARDGISLAKLLEEQTGRVHENAARPSGLVTVGAATTAGKDDVKFKRFKAQFTADNVGRNNAGRVIFGDADTKYTAFQMSPEDLNTLAVRRFQAAEIARFFGVPPHLIGEAADTSAWGSGIEQLTIGFLKYTLEPILKRIEGELELKLLDQTDFYARFDRDALLAMDANTAAMVVQTKINSAQLTPNEARRMQNLPDAEGGDTLLVNSTMVPLTHAISNPSTGTPPKPAEPAATPPKPKGKPNA